MPTIKTIFWIPIRSFFSLHFVSCKNFCSNLLYVTYNYYENMNKTSSSRSPFNRCVPVTDTKSKRCSFLMVLSTARSNTILDGSPTHVLNIRKGCRENTSNPIIICYNFIIIRQMYLINIYSKMHIIKDRFEVHILPQNTHIQVGTLGFTSFGLISSLQQNPPVSIFLPKATISGGSGR